MKKSDFATFDLGQACLRLKDGLSFSVQQGKHNSWYLVEDESRGQFFRIGAAEYTFLSLLDGKTTMSSAMAETCSLLGAKALGEQDAINLCKWLVDTGLAHTRASTSADQLREKHNNQQTQKNIQQLNPISIRIPLVELDKGTETLNRYLGWLVSWPMAAVWVAVVLYGTLSLMVSWDKAGFVEVLSRDNWISMAATWIVLKGIHEAAHVLACKRFGGKIGKGGILFLLLIPMPFVDVTSSWRFQNKFKRILTAAAGMLAEIFLAAVAAIVWANTVPGTLNSIAANVMITASLHTLLFNANPLMRFDGYHMLADWLELPNLGNHGQNYVKGVFRNWFFGNAIRPLEYAGFHEQVIKAYGFAALAWKVLLCAVLTIAASNLLEGIGVLVALASMVLWLALPVIKLAKFVAYGSDFEIPNRKRFAMVSGSILAAIVVLGLLIPAPSVVNAPVVIDYQELQTLRAETPGFVKAVHVIDQQLVQKGDLLVELENLDLRMQLAQTQAELQKARLRAKTMQSEGKIGDYQAEMAVYLSLKKQLDELKKRESNLQLRAPIDGRVIASGLDESQGKYISAGTALVSVGDESRKEAIALISQYDIDEASGSLGQQADVRIWGRSTTHQATFEKLPSKSEDSLPHFAFAGVYGGPLDVLQRQQVESVSTKNDNADDPHNLRDLMLQQPRFVARMPLAASSSQNLNAGEVGVLHLRARSQHIGGYVFAGLGRWLKRQITESHGL